MNERKTLQKGTYEMMCNCSTYVPLPSNSTSTSFQHRLEASRRLDHNQHLSQHSFGDTLLLLAPAPRQNFHSLLTHLLVPRGAATGFMPGRPQHTHILMHILIHMHIPSTYTHPTRRSLAPEAGGTALSRTHCCRRACWAEPSPLAGTGWMRGQALSLASG